MTTPAAVAGALTRLAQYNSGDYEPASNPRGLDDGGHVINFPAALTDMVTVSNWIAGTFAPLAVPETPGIALDMQAGLNFAVTLTGSRAIMDPTGAAPGQSGILIVTQGGAGGHQLTWSAAWRFAGGAPVLSPAAGAIDTVSFFVVSTAPLVILAATTFDFRT